MPCKISGNVFSWSIISNYCPCGVVSVLLNPKDEQVTVSASAVNVLLNPNVDEVLAATVPAPCSAAKEDEESLGAAVPLSQAAVEVDENRPGAIPLSQSVVKKEEKKSSVAILLSHSAVKEDGKPVTSTPRPQLPVMESIPEHKELQKAHVGERPPKKLKLSQEATVQDMAPSITDKRSSALPSRQAVNSLTWLLFYTTCYSCCWFLDYNLIGLGRRHYSVLLICPIPSFVHAYIFPDPCLFIHWSLKLMRGGMRKPMYQCTNAIVSSYIGHIEVEWDQCTNEVVSTSLVGYMVILCCLPLIRYLPMVVIFKFCPSKLYSICPWVICLKTFLLCYTFSFLPITIF